MESHWMGCQVKTGTGPEWQTPLEKKQQQPPTLKIRADGLGGGCGVGMAFEGRCSAQGLSVLVLGVLLVVPGAAADKLRLADGESPCDGRLELEHNGQWGTVCDDDLDMKDAAVVCRQLGCRRKSSVQNLPSVPEGQPLSLSLPPVPWSFPLHFPFPWPSPNFHLPLPEGSDSGHLFPDRRNIRVIGGENNCSGRVEVWHSGTWGTVCDDSWELPNAEVVCRQLDCGSAVVALKEAAYGPGTGTIWMDEVACKGQEASLWDCPAGPRGQSDCKHKEDASVKCSGLSSKVETFPRILWVVLGALLFLGLIILGAHVLLQQRARRKAASRTQDPVSEAVYQELEYTSKEKNTLSFQGSGSWGSETHLQYYTEDSEEGDGAGEQGSHREQEYDIVEDPWSSDIPPSPEGSDADSFPPEDPADGYDDAGVPDPALNGAVAPEPPADVPGGAVPPTGRTLPSRGEAEGPGAGTGDRSLAPEDPDYDDAELCVLDVSERAAEPGDQLLGR
ncbi:antigen WC1.1-like [Ornithorhynchus anatinus]|uniref:antigen WC1.1-like n=1 Tax=Ornithorhynchus anatinus TaxID=9258 RepID=UPI0019D4D5BF|nr:antigen WC1.1-like [Ornithorhynchus anatinus]